MISFEKFCEAKDKKELDEDAVMGAGDCGAAAGDIAAPSNAGDSDVVAKGTSAEDVLGKDCDHHKDGYMGAKCFHIPSNILGTGKMLKREILAGKKKKKNHKNPYEKDMQIISETELNQQLLKDLHSIKEEEMTEIVEKMYSVEIEEVQAIVWCPVTKSFFMRVKVNEANDFRHKAVSRWCEVDFENKQFVKKSEKLLNVQDVKNIFKHVDDDSPHGPSLSSMKFWIVWGGLY